MKKFIYSLLMVSALGFLLGWTSSSTENNQLVTVDIQSLGETNAANLNMSELSSDAEEVSARCYQCDESASTGKCAGSNRCRGTKDSCKKRGCKFTGGSSSSCTASNYKYCKD